MERLRVNYSDGKGVVVPEKKLQNRSERYFFDDTNVLKEGEVYVSPLDLNIDCLLYTSVRRFRCKN